MDTNNDIDDDEQPVKTVDGIDELDDDDDDERIPHRGRRRLLPIERLR